MIINGADSRRKDFADGPKKLDAQANTYYDASQCCAYLAWFCFIACRWKGNALVG